MKRYADSTLSRMTKESLIKIIRCLEHNIEGVEQMNANQFKLLIEHDKYRWHDLRKDPEDLPEELHIVNVAWANHNPVPYYHLIKDKIFSDSSAVYYKGKWFWWSSVCIDILSEYGRCSDEIDPDVEIVAWSYPLVFDEEK